MKTKFNEKKGQVKPKSNPRKYFIEAYVKSKHFADIYTDIYKYIYKYIYEARLYIVRYTNIR